MKPTSLNCSPFSPTRCVLREWSWWLKSIPPTMFDIVRRREVIYIASQYIDKRVKSSGRRKKNRETNVSTPWNTSSRALYWTDRQNFDSPKPLSVVMHGSESYSLTNKQESTLNCFERKILRMICGPICEQNVWRIRANREISELLGQETITKNNGMLQELHDDRIVKWIFTRNRGDTSERKTEKEVVRLRGGRRNEARRRRLENVCSNGELWWSLLKPAWVVKGK